MPQRSFGEELRLLAKRSYASLAGFSHAVGLSPGRVSQIVRGRYPNLSYQTLELLMRVFPDVADKERLYQAWVSEYAPSPLESSLPTPQSSDDAIWSFIEARHALMELGKIAQVREASGKLWRTLSDDSRRAELAYRCGLIFVEMCVHTERSRLAIQIAQAVQGLSLKRYEPAWTATALWQEAVSTYPADPESASFSRSAISRLEQYLQSWVPRSTEERVQHRRLACALARDSLIGLEELYRHRVRNPDLMAQRIDAIRRSYDLAQDQGEYLLAKEVEARGLIALGRLDEAHDALEVSGQNADIFHSIKLSVTQGRLFVAEGDASSAHRLVSRWLPVAEEHHMFHYRSQLVSIEQALLRSQ